MVILVLILVETLVSQANTILYALVSVLDKRNSLDVETQQSAFDVATKLLDCMLFNLVRRCIILY